MEKKQLSTWMQDIEKILSKENLPSIETIMWLSKNIYEGVYVNTEIVFTEEMPSDLIVRFDGSSIIPLAEEVFQGGEIRENKNFIPRMNKYCHMANDRISLFASKMDIYNNKYAVVGIGKLNKDGKWVARLRIEGHLQWTLQIRGNESAIRYDGLFSEQIFENKKIDIPQEFDVDSIEKIKEIVDCAKAQKHGTMIVVLDEEEAEKEADRLCVKLYRGIRVEKFDIRKCVDDVIVPISSIDGAVLIDKKGFCYGIGVILDGKATVPANSARGARFNSAYVYVNNKKKEGKKCLCVVISEDGMINPIGTQNIDEFKSEQINYNELLEDNADYYLLCKMEDYQDGMIEMKEAEYSRLYGDPDSFWDN